MAGLGFVAASVKAALKRCLVGVTIVIVGTSLVLAFHVNRTIETATKNRPPIEDIRLWTDRPQVFVKEALDGRAELIPLNKYILRSNEIPKHCMETLVAVEDKRFWDLDGPFDPQAIGRALVMTGLHKAGFAASKQGASGIAQQTIKNMLLTNDQTLTRKITEMVYAYQLYSAKLSKTDIITLYFNTAYFGSRQYGLENAALFYFGRTALQLSVKECAQLVGSLMSPARFNPNKRLRSKARTETVLKLLAQYSDAHPERIKFTKAMIGSTLREQRGRGPLKTIDPEMDHLYDMAVSEARPYLIRGQGPWRIIMTTDTRRQTIMRDAMQEARREARLRGAGDGAMIVLGKSGGVLALDGSSDYQKIQYNLATAANAQPASTGKIFTYTAACLSGATLNTTILDTPNADGWPGDVNRTPSGRPLKIVDGFAYSLNSIANGLTRKYGTESTQALAARFGVQMDNTAQHAVMGTYSTSPMMMAAVYASFLNDGHGVKPFVVHAILDQTGKTVFKKTGGVQSEQIVSSKCVKFARALMKASVDYGTSSRAGLPAGAMGKTGTSNEAEHTWFFGLYENEVAATWFGNVKSSIPTAMGGGGGIPASTVAHYFNRNRVALIAAKKPPAPIILAIPAIAPTRKPEKPSQGQQGTGTRRRGSTAPSSSTWWPFHETLRPVR